MSTGARIGMDVDLADAVRAMRRNANLTQEGAENAVGKLANLADGAMRGEAPVGAGYDVHMRDTIRADYDRDGLRATVRPHKKTREGFDLHRLIVGNPKTPTYTEEPPPVWPGPDGTAQGPLAEWCDAKFGDPNAAWGLRTALMERGTQLSYPNRFIDRSLGEWSHTVERVAGDEVARALRRGR